jgi:hypothetical protein
MIDVSKLLDSYNRQARLYPALITILPVLLLVATWLPALASVGELAISIAAACGVLFLLADYARTKGKALEKRLLKKWGGWPTTAILRFRDDTLSPEVKNRYHRFLSKQRSIGALPTALEEQSDPARADGRYAAAVSWLKEQCRGDAFTLVDKENTTYGFRRNLAGLKMVGISLCLVTLLSPLVRLNWHAPDFAAAALQVYAGLPAPTLAVIGLTIVGAFAWAFGVNDRWVRQAGDQYAITLLACCDRLPPPAIARS